MKNFLWILILFPSFLWSAVPPIDWSQPAVPDGALLSAPLPDPAGIRVLEHSSVYAARGTALSRVYVERLGLYRMLSAQNDALLRGVNEAYLKCEATSFDLARLRFFNPEAKTLEGQKLRTYEAARAHWEALASDKEYVKIIHLRQNLDALQAHNCYLQACYIEARRREFAAESRARAAAEAHRKAAEQTRAARAAQRRERERVWQTALNPHSEARRAQAAEDRAERARRRSRGNSVWSESTPAAHP